LHNDELRNLYTSQNYMRVVKSRRMECASNVERMGDIRNA